MSLSKSILLISRHPPYASSRAKDVLDIAMTAAVFEQPVSLLFLGDAVLQLLPNQEPQALSHKNLNALQSSLALYEVEEIYTEASALAFHGLTHTLLHLAHTPLQPDQLVQLIQTQDIVINL